MVKKLSELSTEKRIVIKVIAVLLVIALTFTNILVLGKYLGEGLIAYASDSDINAQDDSTNVENVKFEAYLDANNIGIKTIEKDITEDNLTLYVQVKVQGGGVLKNGEISFGDVNFKLKDEVDQNKLKIEMIRSGEGTTIEMGIKALTEGENYNLALLNLISTIKLTGSYTNNDGNEVEINGEKKVKITWNSNLAIETENLAILTQDIITNKIYSINGENKRIVQVLLKSGINKNVYPIKETNIELNVPVLNEEVVPDEIRVSAINGTNSTNGKNAIVKEVEVLEGSLEPNTWAFDYEVNKLKITSVNIETDNSISWKKSGLDEYVVTYIYPENTDMSLFNLESNSSLILYGGENIEVNGNNKLEQEDPEEQSNLLDVNTTITKTASKSNINMGKPIEYYTRVTMGVNYVEALEGITIIEEKDTIYNKEETESYNKSIYKETYLNRAEFLNIFGDDGILEIYNKEGNDLLYKIDKTLDTDENGNITVSYIENVSELEIKGTKPVKEGKLNIFHKKEATINGLTQEEIVDINVLKTKATLVGEKGIEQKEKEAAMKLENPVTVSMLGIDKTSLSTMQPNDVTFTITLKTDDIKYDLYKNPVFEIELPSYINGVEVKEIGLVSGNGLKLLPFSRSKKTRKRKQSNKSRSKWRTKRIWSRYSNSNKYKIRNREIHGRYRRKSKTSISKWKRDNI